MYLYGFDEQEIVRPEKPHRATWPRTPRWPTRVRPDGRYTEHPNERVHRITPLDLYRDLVPGLQRAWTRLMGRPPACRVLALLAAQVAVETGARLTKVHNFNIANAKSGKQSPHVYFTCTECPTEAQLQTFQADRREGHLVEPLDPREVKNWPCAAGKVYTRFHTPHTSCRFRAFDSLDEGIDFYLALLRRPRYVAGWPALEAGDARGFVTALKRGGYYQVTVEQYLKATESQQRAIAARLRCAPTA